MDPRDNPYTPGAGSPPPELAGRDEIIERAAVALDRIDVWRWQADYRTPPWFVTARAGAFKPQTALFPEGRPWARNVHLA